MKRIIQIIISVTFIFNTLALNSLISQNIDDEGIVSKHGLLRVYNAHVVDKNNQLLSLCGNSMFPSNTGWEGQKYYNENVVRWLKKDFNSSIVRVAMGVEESHGYIEDPEGNKTTVKKVIDAAIAEGLYVIIDFHSFQAQEYTAQAVSFFTEMATLYGKYDNVMYEIYNEPLKISWHDTVKPYSETVIKAIRAIDPDNLIIVGSPYWSQKVDVAASDPIQDKNVAYSLHFYAGTHGQWLRDVATEAMKKGIAIFVTEWGTCHSSGNGGFNPAGSEEWMNYCKLNHLSHCVFSVCDKNETTSILKPGASPKGGWTDAELSQAGQYVRNLLKNWPARVEVKK